MAAAQSAAVPRSALRSKSELRIWSTGPVRYSDQRARLMEVRHDTLVATICAGVPEECIVRPVALADVDSMLTRVHEGHGAGGGLVIGGLVGIAAVGVGWLTWEDKSGDCMMCAAVLVATEAIGGIVGAIVGAFVGHEMGYRWRPVALPNGR
ncbi:MAG TPA: hypothetical protein VKH19_08125 [Gemmatimonadaceae bacterium]|nr:hypothetical protein [Gemmatimonadaceae bacterium]